MTIMNNKKQKKRRCPCTYSSRNTTNWLLAITATIGWLIPDNTESFSPLVAPSSSSGRATRARNGSSQENALSRFVSSSRYKNKQQRHLSRLDGNLFGRQKEEDKHDDNNQVPNNDEKEDLETLFFNRDILEEIESANGKIPKIETTPPQEVKVLFPGDLFDMVKERAGFLVSNNDTKPLKDKEEDTVSFSCRIVASSDGKIPTQRSLLPDSLFQPPYLLDKLDTIYHATAHEQTRILKFMENAKSSSPSWNIISEKNSLEKEQSPPQEKQKRLSTRDRDDEDEEKKVISVLRTSLEDAGFELLTRRDLDLCQALNADYLLRLSILEDLSELDGSIAREFYPERFETLEDKSNNSNEKFLYDGRVLVFWRGYGQELTRGRLLLPKIDYLQASIVQRAASKIRVQLNIVEEALAARVKSVYDPVETWALSLVAYGLEMIPSRRVSDWARATIVEMAERNKLRERDKRKMTKDEKLFKLQRYGGYRKSFTSSPNPTDALTPFMICEVGFRESEENGVAYRYSDKASLEMKMNGNATMTSCLVDSVSHDIYEVMNQGKLSCQYDEELKTTMGPGTTLPPMQLLERVSIGNLVDFSPSGTKNFLKTILGKNELLEPTYQEVIVVWRPLPPKPQMKPIITPPKFIYDIADMFDIDGLPKLPNPKDEERTDKIPLEIRAFAGVPMANLPAVLPKTKLVFRPADAFVFDLISVVSLVLVVASQRFDNPRLDLLALVSFTSFLVRTFFRYSNKLARYDLLVKTFLTSKITHRNAGALKYVATEAGSYRATRAALVYTWLASPQRKVTSGLSNTRDQLIRDGLVGVNQLIKEDKPVRVDIDAALRDLEDLDLVFFSEDGARLEKVVRDKPSVVTALSNSWASVFEGGKIICTRTTRNAPKR